MRQVLVRTVGSAAFMCEFALRLGVAAVLAATALATTAPKTATASATPVEPTWSTHFDQIQDPDLLKKIQGYRTAGWAASFKALSQGKSTAELTAQATLTVADLGNAIAADQAFLARNKVDPKSLHPSPAECRAAHSGVTFAFCDQQSKTDQLAAVQGLLELLPVYSSLLPPPPKTIVHGKTSGQVVATVVIKVGSAKGGERRTITPVTQTLAASLGDTVIIGSMLNQKSLASGYTISPAIGVLQPIVSRTHSGFAYLTAIGTGVVTIKFFGPWESAGACPGGSNNWSGYDVNTPPVTGIAGSWVVPTINPNSTYGLSSSWIGIDGCNQGNNSPLIQTGTEQDFNSGAFGIGAGPGYSAWWEVLPQFGFSQSFNGSTPVFPGDLMTASIVPVGTPTPNQASQWVLTLSDATQDWTQTTTQSFNGPLAEAEWIVEATQSCSISCSEPPLADFGSVTFDLGDTITIGGGAPANPNFNPGQAIVMNSGSADFAMPSNPDCDTDGFTVVPGTQMPAPPGPSFASAGFAQGTVGVAYSQTIQTTGAGAVTLVSGSVPGLTFVNGNLSGTPTAAGVYTLSLSASDVNGNPTVTCTQSIPVTIGASPVQPSPPVTSFSSLVITVLTGNDDIRNDSDLQVNFTGINGWPGNQCLVQGNSGKVVAGSACSGGPAGDWNPVVGSWNGWPAWQLQTETKQFAPGTLTFSGSGTMTITFSTHNTGCGIPFGGCGTSNDNWDIQALSVQLTGSAVAPNALTLFTVGNFNAAHNSGNCFWRVKPPGGNDPNSITITWAFPPAPAGNGCPND